MKCQLEKLGVLLVILLATNLSVSAYDFETDGIYYNVVSAQESTCEVAPPNDMKTGHYTGHVVIPSQTSFQGTTLKVVRIGDYAFVNSKKMLSVDLPSTIKVIGKGAFLNCTSLTHITLPNSIVSLGDGAFMGCSSLKRAVVGKEINSIPDGAFSGCSSLSYLAILGPGEKLKFGNQESFVVSRKLKEIEGSNATKSSSTSKKSNNASAPKAKGALGECPLDTIYVDRIFFRHIGNPIVNPSTPKVLIIGSNINEAPVIFNKCENITSVIVESTTPPRFVGAAATFLPKIFFSATLYVPESAIELYREANGWSGFKNIKPISKQ